MAKMTFSCVGRAAALAETSSLWGWGFAELCELCCACRVTVMSAYAFDIASRYAMQAALCELCQLCALSSNSHECIYV